MFVKISRLFSQGICESIGTGIHLGTTLMVVHCVRRCSGCRLGDSTQPTKIEELEGRLKCTSKVDRYSYVLEAALEV